jgi:hypothetical protein
MFSYFEYPGARNVFTIGRPVLKEAIEQLNGVDSCSSDLSAIFEQEKKEVYLDFCHVAHGGNEIIANNIFKTLEERVILR